jgi:hypothetical protein
MDLGFKNNSITRPWGFLYFFLKSLFLILILFGLAKSSWAACSGSGLSWSSTNDLTSLQTCVNNVTREGTVTVSGPAIDWGTGGLTVTKGMTIDFTNSGQITQGRDSNGDYGNSTVINFSPDSNSLNDLNSKFQLIRPNFKGTIGSVGIVVGTDGNTYRSQSFWTAEVPQSSDSQPITGAKWSNYYAYVTDGNPYGANTWNANKGIAYYSYAIFTAPSSPYRNFVIKDGIFNNFGVVVAANGYVWGVIRAQFIDCGTIIKSTGPNQSAWVNYPFSFGTSEQLWLEDSTASFTVNPGSSILYGTWGGGRLLGWTEGGQGGRLAIRYYTIDLTNVGAFWRDMFDIHGVAGGGDSGTMGFEQYGVEIKNDYTAPGNGPGRRFLADRGGQAAVFYNKWSWSGESSNTPFSDVWQEIAGYCTWQTDHVVCTYPEQVDNTYYWSNFTKDRYSTNFVDMGVSKNEDCCLGNGAPQNNGCCNNGLGNAALIEGSQYFTSAGGSVGCGTTKPSTCTPGPKCDPVTGKNCTAYWIPLPGIDPTAASCNNIDQYIGVNHTKKIDGHLYKCIATNIWSTDGDGITYTPYTYPHLLLGPVDAIPPDAPSGLIVN